VVAAVVVVVVVAVAVADAVRIEPFDFIQLKGTRGEIPGCLFSALLKSVAAFSFKSIAKDI
jgi:hypothetical protein